MRHKVRQLIGITVATLLITGLQGCTWLVSISVSEKGKERCFKEIRGAENSFVSELSFRKCLKGIDTILASEEKERLAIAKKKAFITAEGKNSAYIKRWEADRQKLNMALNHSKNYENCENFPESVSEGSLELNRSICKRIIDDLGDGEKRLKELVGSACSMITVFESWYEWAVLNNREGHCDEFMQDEIQDR
jgi:hypothetical protein